jgi:DASH complex subunit SPC19
MSREPLTLCVSSLTSSNDILASSVATLDSGVNDFPRMGRVLDTTRHYDIIPYSQLLSAQNTVVATLTPEVRTLIATLERQLDRLERRADSLEARYRLLEGRVEWYLSARPFLAQEAHNDDNGEHKEVEGWGL